MPHFSPERWQRVEALLDEVLDLPPDERRAWLDVHCGDDEALRADVEALLEADEAEGDFLSASATTYADALISASGNAPLKPEEMALDTRVGPYRLVALLGHGGMAAVYLAERDDGLFEQQVAVKLIKRGMDSEAVRRRFLAERQILARLQHPHIARLLDGGLADDGQSYFVMDYVPGTPITDYSTEHALDLTARLHLFEDVCRAVEYAHRNLVVHRDLKPSNILVTDDGRVKLLDFGIAKMLAEDEAPIPAQTVTGIVAMTPEYASPEQVRGEAITTATDVYALGVVLYELMTNERPYYFESRSPTEIERVICDTEPRRPSTAVLQRTEAATENAAVLHRKLRGDLDNIVLKALRKEPERRYASAAHLLDDLQRYRDGLPVLARPDTVGYRLRKFVQRHRMGVAMAAAFLMLSFGFALFYTLRVTAERDRAQAEAERARETRDLLISMFGAADPDAGRGDTLTARELLALGTTQIEAELANQPDLQAEMLAAIGEVYRKLGTYDDALPLLERALAQARELHGPVHADVATAHSRLGEVLYDMGDYERAETHLRDALRLRRQLFGERHAAVAQSLDQVAALVYEQGSFDEAERLYREALTRRHTLFGPNHLDVAETQNNLGILLTELAKYDEAETVLREALAVREAQLGTTHSAVAETIHNLGFLYWDRGLYEEAEPFFRRSLDIAHTLYGDEHPSLAIDLNNLSLLLRDMGDYDEAESVGRQALAMQQKFLGPTHRDVSTSLYNLADLLMLKGAYTDAEPLLLESLQIDLERYGDAHPYIGMARTMYTNLLLERGALDEASTEIQQALAIFEAAYPDGHYRIADARLARGRIVLQRGQPNAAEPDLREALALLATFSPDDDIRTLNAQHALGQCLTAQQRFDEAETLLRESHATAETNLGPTHPVTQQLRAALAELYQAWSRPDEAARYTPSI